MAILNVAAGPATPLCSPSIRAKTTACGIQRSVAPPNCDTSVRRRQSTGDCTRRHAQDRVEPPPARGRQAALEPRVVAHHEAFRGRAIVACVNPPVVRDQQHPRIDRSPAARPGVFKAGWADGKPRINRTGKWRVREDSPQDRFKPQAGRQTLRHVQPLSQAATCCHLSASTTSAPSAARCTAPQSSIAAAIVS